MRSEIFTFHIALSDVQMSHDLPRVLQISPFKSRCHDVSRSALRDFKSTLSRFEFHIVTFSVLRFHVTRFDAVSFLISHSLLYPSFIRQMQTHTHTFHVSQIALPINFKPCHSSRFLVSCCMPHRNTRHQQKNRIRKRQHSWDKRKIYLCPSISLCFHSSGISGPSHSGTTRLLAP